MKRAVVIRFVFVVTLTFFSLSHPSFSLGDNLSVTPSPSTPVKIKASKKTKKKHHKKSKSTKLKVAKSPAGSQDEVSDQTDVSQQADQSGTKKR